MGESQPPYSEDSLYLNVWTPACDDARRPGVGLDPRRRVHLGLGRHTVVRRHQVRGARRCGRRDDQLSPRPVRLPASRRLVRRRIRGVRQRRHPRSDRRARMGARLHRRVRRRSRTGHGVRRVGRRRERRHAARYSSRARLVPCARSRRAARPRGCRHARQATKVAQLVLDKLGVQAGDVDAHPRQVDRRDPRRDARLPRRRRRVAPVPARRRRGRAAPAAARRDRGRQCGRSARADRHEPHRDDAVHARPTPRWAPSTTTRSGADSISAFGPTGASLLDDYRSRRPDATPQELWLALSTDGVFRIPAIRLLEAQAAHAPVWSYLFTFESPVFGGILRSTHALEIPFVFDTLDGSGADMLTGTGPERQGIADSMHGAWIAFARHGDPSHAGIPEWPALRPRASGHDALRRRVRGARRPRAGRPASVRRGRLSP